MKVVNGLYYSKEHEWVKVEGEKAYVGITDYAQHSLGDIVFVELPDVDSEIETGDSFGVVESVKAASDIYSPLSGTILEVNENLEDSPQLLNEDPYENYICIMQLSNMDELKDLMTSEDYEAFCKNN